jgi:hypothetical protein
VSGEEIAASESHAGGMAGAARSRKYWSMPWPIRMEFGGMPKIVDKGDRWIGLHKGYVVFNSLSPFVASSLHGMRNVHSIYPSELQITDMFTTCFSGLQA